MKRAFSHVGVLAACLSIAAAWFVSAGLGGYSHRVHPLGLLGAYGIPHALAFNLCGWIAPGLLAAWLGWRLREGMQESGWPARIGAWLTILSALAFAAQGVARLDPQDLDAATSRLHATSWMLWWLAFVPGAGLLACGLALRADARGLAIASAMTALAVLLFAVFAQAWMPAAVAHRIAFGCWFAWLVVAGYAAGSRTRSAA